jgi:NAD(P)-dependent dehydrogenase (short-subunit alcohol dehydrogenase family)
MPCRGSGLQVDCGMRAASPQVGGGTRGQRLKRRGPILFLASNRLKMDPEKLYHAYPVSKTALNAATVLLANALERDGIRVNACCLGMVVTRVSRMQGKSPGRRRRLHRLDSENDRKWAYGRLLQSNRPHRLVTSMPERKNCKIIRERAWSTWSRMICAKWRTAMAQRSLLRFAL